MNIACLGWGSLIWDPRTLPVRKPWFQDGPMLPIEFTKHSSGDRITLVITPGAASVRSLWALMTQADIELAKKALAEREGIKEKHVSQSIGYYSMSSKSSGECVDTIGSWASQKGLDAVIWTALKPKFGEKIGKIPSVEDVISFLHNLSYERRKHAERYIRMAPLQIDTDYRRRIECEFNWTPISSI